MRILITGNMGYLGPAVVKRLRHSFPQATLIGFDIGYFAHCLTAVDLLPECRVDVQYFADVRNFPTKILEEGIDVIVHLAAISNDPIGNLFEEVTLDINYHASVALANTAKQYGVKSFIFAASCSMYGFADDTPRKETSLLNPLTAYAKSKVWTEQALQRLADKNFIITSLRFSTACGMSERLRLDLVVNDFVACAIASKNITILSDGTPWRPLIHIDDMARAIDWAIQRDRTSGGDFLAVNVGSSTWNYQVKDLATEVANRIPDVSISINQQAQADKRSYKVDFSFFERLAPDFQPQVDLATTIAELKKGLEAMEFQDSNFRNSKYMRLIVLNSLKDRGLLNNSLAWTLR